MIFQGQGNRAGLLERLDVQCVLDSWQLKNGPFPDVEYREKDIRHISTERAVLDESRFKDCHLEEGEFLQSNLQDVSMDGCELDRIGFTSCQLRSSRWTGTKLKETRFKGCAAPRLEMKKVVLENCRFEEAEVNRGILEDCCFWKTSLTAEHPSGTTGFRNSVFERSLFLNCYISGSAFAFAALSDCVFLNCQFFQVDWECVERENSRFIDCVDGPPEWHRPVGRAAADSRGWSCASLTALATDYVCCSGMQPTRPCNRGWEAFEQEVLSGTA